MRILAVYPHLKSGEEKTDTKRYFPWGFATVLSCLKKEGHQIRLIDAYGEDLVRSEVEALLGKEPFDCVCISGFASMNYVFVCWLSEVIKKRFGKPVIVGGVLADHHFNLLLSKKHADICVLGEGEKTAVELMRNFDSLDMVKGIAYLKDGEVKVKEKNEIIENLDDLSMPDFDLWNMPRYTTGDNLWLDDKTTRIEGFDDDFYDDLDKFKPNMSIFAGRGCPYSCKFCSKSFENFRVKSIPRIIKEMKLLKDRFGIKAFHFYDELLIYRKDRTIEFCNAVKDIGVYWDCQARVNTINKDILSILKASNCISVGLGFESGSNKMLKAMNKCITREQSLEVLRGINETGMHVKLQFMFGYPGENKHTVKETIALVEKSALPPRRMLWCTPLPGSPLYDEAVREGIVKDEETHLKNLAKGMNHPGHVFANVSGSSDRKMTSLYLWAHMMMEFNYLKIILWKYKNPKNLVVRNSILRLLRYTVAYFGLAPICAKVYHKLRNLSKKSPR